VFRVECERTLQGVGAFLVAVRASIGLASRYQASAESGRASVACRAAAMIASASAPVTVQGLGQAISASALSGSSATARS
jgi:hypothetical protein